MGDLKDPNPNGLFQPILTFRMCQGIAWVADGIVACYSLLINTVQKSANK